MSADGPTLRGATARLVSLVVADHPGAWEAAGFEVVDDTVNIAGTDIVLTGRAADRADRGIRSITVSGLSAPQGDGLVDGIPVTFTDGSTDDPAVGDGSAGEPRHPNGTIGIDHVVIITPDLDRTIDAFARIGLAVRRFRETESYGAPMKQAFMRLGPTIVEVVGGHEGTGQSADEAPARWFGLALDVVDLDATAALLGEGLGGIKPAVQEGRRIATIRHKQFGMSVATALMDNGA